ncbi:MAG: transposase [Armatimonadetes bacterium]|nr:transposase [Armatimonadota bacterium]
MAEKRKKRETFNTPGHLHGLTFSTYRRLPFLADAVLADLVAGALFSAGKRLRFEVRAFVVMPEHCHVLVWPREDVYDMAAVLTSIKSEAAKACFTARPELREVCRVPRRGRPDEFKFWQPGGGYDRNYWSRAEIRKFIDYLHNNPVRRGLCLYPEDYRWSSVLAYMGRDCPWPVDLSPE